MLTLLKNGGGISATRSANVSPTLCVFLTNIEPFPIGALYESKMPDWRNHLLRLKKAIDL